MIFSSEVIDLCSIKGDVKKLYRMGGDNAAQVFTLCELCLAVYVEMKGILVHLSEL